MDTTTQDQSTKYYSETIVKNNLWENLKIYLLNPIYMGIVGFAAFFSLILLTNLFSYFLGMSNTFSIELNDVMLSLTGFVFAAGAKFLEFFSKEEN